ncbi:MAG: GvpL/GvpF family gas vesicle protein, partial [Bacteroidota bacterium]
LNETRKRVVASIQKITVDCKIQPEVSQQLTGRKESNFLNLAMLTKSEEIEKIKRKIKKVQKESLEIGILFEITGPWPPYSFVNNG